MGYGGDLIWSGVFRELQAADGREIVVAHTPKLSDLLTGHLYNRSAALATQPVFTGNPRLRFYPVEQKGPVSRFLDFAFAGLLKVLSLRRFYEQLIFRLAQCRNGPRLVHVDMLILGYVARETRKQLIWKEGEHAIAVMLRGFGIAPRTVRPELYLDAAEEQRAQDILRQAGATGRYVVFEPDTNRDWFGELRAWPHERWTALISVLKTAHPDIAFVQVGVDLARLVPSVVDLRGKTTFREAAALIKRSALFIGTEGGLMHAARAVEARALILWGGVTLPEFAGYPDSHVIICHRVACAPCGQRGWCDNDHICMRGITVEEATAAARASLAVH